MTAIAWPWPYIAAPCRAQPPPRGTRAQPLTAEPRHGLKNPMPEQNPKPKAELAAAARAARKAAAEAAALRANLHKRKAQARAAEPKPAKAVEGSNQCP